METFPRAGRNYLVCYPFEGRLAHQTLGMLLTRRLERARLRPLGFVANEYALAVWGLGDPAFAIRNGELSLAVLFDQDMLGDDLEEWLAESALMKRTFRQCAIVAGLIERRAPGEEKNKRQMTISTDLVYDVLRRHQADHVLLRAAHQEAGGRPSRYRPPRRHAGPRPRAHRARSARPRVAAGGAGDAGDRPRIRLWRGIGAAPHRGRGGARQRGHAMRGDSQTRAVMGRESGASGSLRAGGLGSGRGPGVTGSPACPGDDAICGVAEVQADLRVAAAGANAITVAGVTLIADLAGALYWPEERLLAVSDLHLEKGSSFAARGVLLPPYDTVATLERLAGILSRRDVRTVVALGDNFHGQGGPARLAAGDRARLSALQRDRDWICLAGNHDPGPTDGVGGDFASALALGPLLFRHEPAPDASPGEIAGHLHPVARISRRGHTLTRRCFASNEMRLVMPAFGAYTGSLNIRHAAFAQIFGARDFTAHVLGQRRLYAFAATRCLGDGGR
jgi:DNA ligase-associated metallophosphoesterase